MCTYCQTAPHTCIISAFIGKNSEGGLETIEVARLCNTCVELLLYGQITIPNVDGQYTFDQAINSMER